MNQILEQILANTKELANRCERAEKALIATQDALTQKIRDLDNAEERIENLRDDLKDANARIHEEENRRYNAEDELSRVRDELSRALPETLHNWEGNN
jgi:predicted  nucleic acid-binding Zn-ribbon protein